jgi:hypothetical protein
MAQWKWKQSDFEHRLSTLTVKVTNNYINKNQILLSLALLGKPKI